MEDRVRISGRMPELSKLRFKSYYIHNKILIIEYIIKWANKSILQFKDDYAELLKNNEFLVVRGATPKTQRSSYVQTLESFIKMVDESLKNLRNNNAQSIAQAKVYNLQLMKHPYITAWRYERTYFRYFKTKRYKENLDLLDRIDDLIKGEAEKMIKDAERRMKNNDDLK